MILLYKVEEQRVSGFALGFDFFHMPRPAYAASINLKYQRASRLILHLKLKLGPKDGKVIGGGHDQTLMFVLI